MGRACTVAYPNRSSPIITPVCAGPEVKLPFMLTCFGEPSIGYCESNAMTSATSRRSLESSNMPEQNSIPGCTRIGIYLFQESCMYLIDILIAVDLSQFLLLAIIIKHLNSL